MIAFWILDPLYNALGGILAAFYSVLPHYGIAIMLLTASVSLIRMPLVSKQVRSQQEMQRVQPELKRIQAKYKSDPQKRNEEVMRVYKENNVNPLASCLPLLLQMPLFIVLYRLILDLAASPPKHLPQPSRLYSSLVEDGGEIPAFGMDLARRATDMSGGGLVAVGILIALVVATGFFQTRQMQSRLPKESMNSQMAVVGKVMPIMFGVISFTIPAGVVLYFLVSNAWQIGQQGWMYRHQKPGASPAPAPRDDEDDPKGSLGNGDGRARGKDGNKDGKAGGAQGKGVSKAGGAKSKGGSKNGSGGRTATSKSRGGSGGAQKGSTSRSPGRRGSGAGGGQRGRPPAPGRNGRAGRGRVTPPKGGSPSRGAGPGGPGKRVRGDGGRDS